MIHIGKLIGQKLQEQGKDEEWLAQQLGCRPSQVHYIENQASIETDTLLRLSEILGYNFFQDYSRDFAQARLL